MYHNQEKKQRYVCLSLKKKRLLSEWQQSNLKMKVFCEQKQISVNALKNWIKQFDIGRKRKVCLRATASM
ncbi:IS66 family insertion sequence element accessory protein TnpA [Chitinophaga pinensis]|uniref:IS66 family insertion sequence element accessory protein TnpA n=1 Tax=Chitinophaga pinensis TaxID=79329 RepID=UPI00398C76F5